MTAAPWSREKRWGTVATWICAVLLLALCIAWLPAGAAETLVPLSDLGTAKYQGYQGGLYPHGTNQIPEDHFAGGIRKAAQLVPRDIRGLPAPGGRIILLSVGMSNARHEFCGDAWIWSQCPPWTFGGQAWAAPAVNHTSLLLFNGAQGGGVTARWEDPAGETYENVRSELAKFGLTEAQVQIVWMKGVSIGSRATLPNPEANAHVLLQELGQTARTLRIRFPNLQLVFVSSRIYGGYASPGVRAEPFSFEGGFAHKWLVEAQIKQMRGEGENPTAGNLDYTTVAPWIAWGPYLWADGPIPRSDGLLWLREDFDGDGVHPSPLGQEKVGMMLLQFFNASPITRGWFSAR